MTETALQFLKANMICLQVLGHVISHLLRLATANISYLQKHFACHAHWAGRSLNLAKSDPCLQVACFPPSQLTLHPEQPSVGPTRQEVGPEDAGGGAEF
ncbi:hypothetical protein ACPOL_7079 (plasmid) [Acidisarcina polymorpha]|uniref:Uncharacterized protein n=1 Tax=Acidisarcina polymorpha TaxID=2211140 RepID=A0A2Z5GAY6_9BACT|nr:hypothetical protein ACPOL_7079 [Acidisarcina polymorpha]